MLIRTPLYDFHVACGAKMVEYAGWEMPILYRGISEEHIQTRQSGSLFDVSHMGRLHITGKEAIPLINYVLTRNVEMQKIGQSRYSLVCNAAGGVLDDVIVSKDVKHWLIVCNAANRAKIVKHLNDVRDVRGFAADIADQTESTAMVAMQGPKAVDYVGDILGMDLRSIPRYGFEIDTYMMTRVAVFRSGYTGEDGVELIVSARMASGAVKSLSEEVRKPESPIRPAGLGARDTLRLEAAMPLYGHELTESTDPISAGLQWAVDLKKEFLGVEPLRVIAERGPARKLIGLELDGRRIARQGSAIRSGAIVVGEVTSGTFAPTLQKSIAMAYVDSNFSAAGTALEIDCRGTLNPARVVPLPFYKRPA